MFDGTIYPEFLSGAGYILPIEVLPCLYQEGGELLFTMFIKNNKILFHDKNLFARF